MKQGVILLNSFTLLILGLIHFYWAFGGKRWLNYAIPTNPNPEVSFRFKPGIVATLFVGVGLLAFSLIIASNISQYNNSFYNPILTRAIGIIFLLRAIGDFNYIGIKKKVTNTVFSKKDGQLFVPLSFWLGTSTLLISII